MLLLSATAFIYGVRHGIDWDHLAAITDVTSTQDTPRRGLLVATAYAIGHGVVVFVLGLAAIVAGRRLPSVVDGVMERLVGVTLIVLAFSVVVGLIRDRRDFRIRSRWMFILAGASRARRWARHRFVTIRHEHVHDHDHEHVHEHEHVHVNDHHHVQADLDEQHEPSVRGGGEGERDASADGATVAASTQHRHEHIHIGSVPDDPFAAPGPRIAAGIGMLHGVGAETPTQIVVFLAAANVARGSSGVLLLVCFIIGIFVSNTMVAVASSYGYLSAARNFRVYATIALVNACASLVIGTVFVTGRGLPTILGG
ncbi:MAG: hypothetical protein JWN62_4718 [Acidimicrobiales bacterium]|nr:hypothetical protein [Acidimicrobiales bacterium]